MARFDLLAGFFETVFPAPKWQIPLLIALIVLIIGYWMYRKKQM